MAFFFATVVVDKLAPRSERITIAVTAAERAAITIQASVNGCTVGDYVRLKALRHGPGEVAPAPAALALVVSTLTAIKGDPARDAHLVTRLEAIVDRLIPLVNASLK